MPKREDYALDLISPVRHVATLLEVSDPMTAEELARGFPHFHGDLSRIMIHEGAEDEWAARVWLINRALIELGSAVERDDQDRWKLIKKFEDLRFKGRKFGRVREETEDEKRKMAISSAYGQLTNARAFTIKIVGPRGGQPKERRVKPHKLALLLPILSREEFESMAADMLANGIIDPIELVGGDQVLDGRHRTAIASALDLPVRVVEVSGSAGELTSRALSKNVWRRHLTKAQIAWIVRETILPEEIEKADDRRRQGQQNGGKTAGRGRPKSDSSSANLRASYSDEKATEAAAERVGGAISARSIEQLEPLDKAPQTQARLLAGDPKLKTVEAARRAALVEQGEKNPQPKPPSRTARRLLTSGAAISAIRAGEAGNPGGTPDDLRIALKAYREAGDGFEAWLNRAEQDPEYPWPTS